MRLAYVVAVHNEEAILERTVERLVERLAPLAPADVLLCENGSTDGSWALCQRLAGERSGVTVLAYREPEAGIGFALARGVREALARHGAGADHFIVFTAADLPFGFSDLDEFLALVARGGDVQLAIGSKAHPRTRMDNDWRRRLGSAVYALTRRLLLSMATRDPQGTFFLRADLAARVAGHVEARNWFYTTELTCLVERAGVAPVELPVVYAGEQRRSSVHLVRDGSRMFLQLVRMRRRLASSA